MGASNHAKSFRRSRQKSISSSRQCFSKVKSADIHAFEGTYPLQHSGVEGADCSGAEAIEGKTDEMSSNGGGTSHFNTDDNRGTSLVRNTPLLGPYHRTIPRVI